jgi:hypothetical protein
MASKETLARELAAEFANLVAQKFFGADGPDLDCDIDEIEDVAVAAARAAFDATIARALELQTLKLPRELPCPKCGEACETRREARVVQGRMGPATIEEPVGHCPACERDFFPSAGSIAAR